MELEQLNAWQLIVKGGPIMIPLVLCSIIGLSVVIAKVMYFASIATDTQALRQEVFAFLKSNRVSEAVAACENSPSPVAKILLAGILKLGDSRENISHALEESSRFAIPELEKQLPILSTIAHMAPLLGLLGTVTGLTNTFHSIQVAAASMNPMSPGDFAGGISQAMLTTVAGLIIAICAFVTYNYLLSRVNHFILDMEKTGNEILNYLTQVSSS